VAFAPLFPCRPGAISLSFELANQLRFEIFREDLVIFQMPSQTCTLTEGEALKLARQGDSAAFERLYRLHSHRVYSLCLRMVRNPSLAEDLTQETFLAAFRGLRDFRGHSAFSTWLYRVARNTVLMCFRKKRVNEVSLDEFAEARKEDGRPPVEPGIPDHRVEGLPDRLLLQTAVGRLSEGFRSALVLHDVHGYEHREIASILGWATGTSKSQLHKARLRVRESIVRCQRSRAGHPSRSSSKVAPGLGTRTRYPVAAD
jgi:RNA polymerase sigma-70 factor (ECF subfamily)